MGYMKELFLEIQEGLMQGIDIERERAEQQKITIYKSEESKEDSDE
tara:strand:+ start:212 stop:349 length:138 start_codon:yes stop_codon:yes gene_type:complete